MCVCVYVCERERESERERERGGESRVLSLRAEGQENLSQTTKKMRKQSQ